MLVRSTPRGRSFGVVPGVQANLLVVIRVRLAGVHEGLGASTLFGMLML